MIVLDTHVWLWWMSATDHLSAHARDAIEQAPTIGVSTLSAWEIAMLSTRGRISLDRDVRKWVRQALSEPRVEALVPTADIAVAAGLLTRKEFPGDPADRLIYATARSVSAPLVTRDKGILAFDQETTIW